MLAKISAFVLSIVMSVASLFGAPFDDLGGSSLLNQGSGLYGELPKEAVVASNSQIATIRSGKWVSAAKSSTTMQFEQQVPPNEIPRHVPDLNDEFPDGSFPADLQKWTGNGGCNNSHSFVFFSGATMNKTKFGYSTLIGCDPNLDQHEKQAHKLFNSKPVIHVVPGSENNEIYLVTGDGAAKFKRA